MLVDKLLVNIFLVFVPLLVYSALSDHRHMKHAPLLMGGVLGVSSVLCLIFSYFWYGLYWDLRYVPLILSVLYFGPKAGVLNITVMVMARMYVGPESMQVGLLSMILCYLGPLLVRKRFMQLKGMFLRVGMNMLVGIWINVIMLIILLLHSWINGRLEKDEIELLKAAFFFGMIQFISIGASSFWMEFSLEREDMRKKIRHAERINTLGELAASMAHEVRNPLTVVKGFLQMVQSGLEGKNRRYIALALAEVDRAERIISDYLNLSRPQIGKTELMDLSGMVQQIVLLLKPMATKQGVRLYTELRNEIYVHTDRNQLLQALVHVTKNAIEAAEDGGRVYITLAIQEEKACLNIRDNGKGMSQEHLERVGTLFFSTKEVGTGLGTAVSFRIIEAMNGSIRYESEPGVGTEVIILLPLAQESLLAAEG
ncbi:sensor histidine kinase [Paenibacillus kribbensis]|uniref:sensor histidine kinase n=1 Tax=Paenibacillus kribbensis TaxID=172713 RepID=UPI000838E98E|nr:HAMP domain-containing sensor histidine kinase [Paenibacillus kribbensis]